MCVLDLFTMPYFLNCFFGFLFLLLPRRASSPLICLGSFSPVLRRIVERERATALTGLLASDGARKNLIFALGQPSTEGGTCSLARVRACVLVSKKEAESWGRLERQDALRFAASLKLVSRAINIVANGYTRLVNEPRRQGHPFTGSSSANVDEAGGFTPGAQRSEISCVYHMSSWTPKNAAGIGSKNAPRRACAREIIEVASLFPFVLKFLRVPGTSARSNDHSRRRLIKVLRG